MSHECSFKENILILMLKFSSLEKPTRQISTPSRPLERIDEDGTAVAVN